ncbi:MAG: AAA family ATPase [Polyangiales bacterium]
MWVKRLRLENFRGFASLDLDLDRPLTVLVGVNGSGKTSVLRAIASAQGWIPSFFLLTHPYSAVEFSEIDLRVGTTTGSVLISQRHADQEFDFGRVWKGEWKRWVGTIPSQGPPNFSGHEPLPFIFLVGTNRFVSTADVRALAPGDPASEIVSSQAEEDTGVVILHPGYSRFVEWFKEREDVENERRVAERDFTVQDPQLQAVREVVAALMPGFDNLRIKRAPSPAMVVTKGGVELRLDQLSDGERNLIALAGDLARRMAIVAPEGTPAREVEGHPHRRGRAAPPPCLAAQRRACAPRAFPKAQLIVTTHSPQVLSSVPASSIVVLDGEHAYPVTEPTEGRDSNAILREVFGVPERPRRSPRRSRRSRRSSTARRSTKRARGSRPSRRSSPSTTTRCSRSAPASISPRPVCDPDPQGAGARRAHDLPTRARHQR